MKSTHQSFSISFVCGPPGSGKSFCMVLDVIERLSSAFTGKIITNLPLEADKIAAYVAGKTGRPLDDVRAQIVLLDKETLREWREGKSGPWALAESDQADGNDFILDECHNFCPKQGQSVKTRNERWQLWLGEVRHEGWRRIVFVTQDEAKVGQPISIHAELRFELTNNERRRDPILRIPIGQWLEVVASFTREYRASVAIVEYRRVKGKLREQHVEKIPLDPIWFPFYRSYEAGGGGTGEGKGGSAIVREYQRRPIFMPGRKDGRTVAPTWLWFLRVNWWRFFLAFVVTSAVGWLTIGGGLQILIALWTDRLVAVATTNGTGANKHRSAPGEPEQVLDEPGAEVPTQARRASAVELAAALQRMPEADRQVMVAELASFADQYEKATKRANKREATMRAQQKLVKVVAVTDETAWFTDPPCSCQIGEVLDEGPYKGKRVERLDVDRGWVELSGGVKLWIGRGVVDRVPAADAADGRDGNSTDNGNAGPRFPRPVPAVDADGSSDAESEADRSSDNDVRSGDGLRSILKGSGEAKRPVGSGG